MAEHDLESVRAELQRLGYLTHGLERMLLQDALRSRTGLRAALRLAARSALLAGALLAAPVALGLAMANGNLAQSPFDLAPLVLHVWPPLAVAAGFGFLILAGIEVLIARSRPGRASSVTGSILAALAAAATTAFLAWQARALVDSAPLWQLALAGVVTAATAVALWRLLRSGLFALTVRFTEPRLLEAFAPRVWLALGVAAAALLIALPVVLALRPAGPGEAPSNLPLAPGERVLLVGFDGVLPAELEYLLQHGDLPALARLATEGLQASYRREDESPASFWTTVSTGVPTALHGVAALDSFRPLGVRTALTSGGFLRAYWQGVEVPLRLAEYRPVLSNRRSAFTVWELAARGGAPALAVDWWGTYPAEVQPGLVVAHGAYQLLGEHAPGALASRDAALLAKVAEAREHAVRPAAQESTLRAALPAPEAERLLELAFRPDRFYLDTFREGVGQANPPRAAALYLPGLDIAAAAWTGPPVGFADVVRDALVELDRSLSELLPSRFDGTVALVFDPGRRGGLDGRVILWRPGGCSAHSAALAPGQVAAALFRALGLPQSAQLPEPPASCSWPEPPARVPAYGERLAPRGPGAAGDEYLKNLRSLGYL